MAFVKFMGSQAGRAVRIVAGLALLAIGRLVVGGTGGWVVAAIGLLPLAAGLFDFCIFAPLLGYPFGGKQLRAKTDVGSPSHSS
ncbi:MAG: hypothetical protein NVSMB47_11110 [Polyangiales bacterium]